MALIRFEPQYVPDSYSARVRRFAVLDRIWPPSKNDVEIMDRNEKTVWLWRGCLRRLAANGWRPRNSNRSLFWAKNCTPTFAFCRPQSRPCGLEQLCPFCYGRHVAELWANIDRGVMAEAGTGQWKLVEREFHSHFTFEGQKLTVEEALMRLPGRHVNLEEEVYPPELRAYAANALRLTLARSAERRAVRIRHIDPRGALCTLTVEPWYDSWHFVSRLLLLVPQDFPLPDDRTRNEIWKAHSRITRKGIVHAVARTCAYPEYLLRGPAAMTAVQLQARNHIRLTATFGVFRNRRQANSDAI